MPLSLFNSPVFTTLSPGQDVEYTLSKLRDWRDQGGGPKIGIVDNFDDRLDTILRELGIRDFFDFVVVSRLAGSE